MTKPSFLVFRTTLVPELQNDSFSWAMSITTLNKTIVIDPHFHEAEKKVYTARVLKVFPRNALPHETVLVGLSPIFSKNSSAYIEQQPMSCIGFIFLHEVATLPRNKMNRQVS
jgi:hypothetical protein